MCKWIDAARLSMIGRALNSSRYGERGFCLKFADLEIAQSEVDPNKTRSIPTRPPEQKVRPLVSCSEALVQGWKLGH
jgi:hypothetical protein